MHISASGLRLIAQSEGCYLTAYKCPAGVLTIGYGHTSAAGAPEVHPGQKITQDEATAILKNDIEQFDHYVTESVKVHLEQHEFDALSSFVFNVGPGNFRKSTLLKKLNKGDKASVPAELLKWDRAHGKVLPGLTTRRHAEAALWCGAAIDVKHDPNNKCSQVVDKPKKGFHPTLTHASPAIAGSLVSHHSLGSLVFNDKQLVLFAAYTLLIAAVYAAGVFTLPLIHRFTQRKGS